MAATRGARRRPPSGAKSPRPTTTAREARRPSALAQRAAALAESPPVRWFRRHPDIAAALFFVGLVVAYMLPVLIGTKILTPSTALYAVTPWTAGAPSEAQHYFNPLLTDIPLSNYPWREFTWSALHHGTLPQWFPQTFTGAPLLNNPQVGLFTPFNLPVWLLPLNYGLGLSAALKLWAAGFGTYLLVRRLGLGWLPGLLAGTAFTFSAYNITWLAHETVPAVAVMLPWTLWLIEGIFERGRARTALWLAVVTAIAMGGGHPGTQVHVLALAGLYALIRVWLLEDLERGARLRLLGLTLGGVALGVLLMAVMLIPEALSSHGTVAISARAHGGTELPGTGMPFDAIKTTLFPDWWGRPSGRYVAKTAGSASSVNYNERTFYVGVVAALLAVVALAAPGRWRTKAPFAVFAAIGLAIPLRLPGLWQLITHVPPFDVVQNQRLHLAYGFGASVLAAFALRDLLDRPAGQRRGLVVPGVAIGLGLIVLLAIASGGTDLGHTFTHFVAGTSYQSKKVIELTSTAWFVFFALGVGAAMLLAFRHPRWRYGVAVGVVLLAATDGLHFAKGYQPMGPASTVIPPRTEAIDYLVAHAGDSRVNGLGFTLGLTWDERYGLSDIRGYSPPNPTRRFLSLWLLANPDQEPGSPITMGAQGEDQVQVESVLGARYVVADPGSQLQPQPLDPVLSALRVVYDRPDAVIIENTHAAPRVELPRRILLATGEDDANTRIVDPSFSPENDVVIESTDPVARALARGPAARGRVTIARQANATTTLEATLDRTGLVVLNDSLTDGWTVKVDGRPARIVRVNSVMRGVVAGPGRHRIVWTYETPGLKAGAGVSLLALLVLLAAMAVLILLGRRAEAPIGVTLTVAPPREDEPAPSATRRWRPRRPPRG